MEAVMIRCVMISALTISMVKFGSSEAKTLTLSHRVKVSLSVVAASKTLGTVPVPSGGPFHIFTCSAACGLEPWCDLWCYDASSSQCFLSDMIVMPGYAEGNASADALTCYTRRHRDFATGAAIAATTSTFKKPLRVKENLVDGIYDLQTIDECFRTSTQETNHWFVLDFGRPVRFRVVKLFTQPSGYLSVLATTRNLELRTGMAAVDIPGDFSSYDLFNEFPGPAREFHQEIVLEARELVTARFVSVQKKDDTEVLQLCHIEIY